MTGLPFRKLCLDGQVAEFPRAANDTQPAGATGGGDEAGTVRLGDDASFLLRLVAAFYGRSPEELLTRAIVRQAEKIGLRKLESVQRKLRGKS